MPVTAAMCAAGRVVAEPRLSPDGATLAFLSAEHGAARLVVAGVIGGPEMVLTADGPPPAAGRPLASATFDWLPDGSGLVYVAVDGGLWCQPGAGGPAEPWGTPLTGRLASPVIRPDGQALAVTVDGGALVVVDRLGGATLVAQADHVLDPVWSPDGALLAWSSWDEPSMPWHQARVEMAPADGSAPGRVVAGGAGSAAQQPRFSPDGRSLALLDDSSGWLNVTIVGLDGVHPPTVVTESHEHGGPAWGPGQRSFAWSPDGSSIALCRNESGFGRLVVWTPGEEPVTVARGVHGGLSWVGGHLAAVRTGGRTPTQIVVHPMGGAEPLTRRVVAVGPVAGLGGVEPELVEWLSDDGATIPGRLYRPAPGPVGGGSPPLIVWVHGGPNDQWQVEWRSRILYWLDRGWAVLVPDHRGSTGHGRAFTLALDGRWGDLDVGDVAAGVRAAIDRGWGDPARLVAMGGSAGGFTVLHLLARHPGLVAAAVDLYGVTDVREELAEPVSARPFESLVGPAGDAVRIERSPLTHAPAIVDPLLVLHGEDDPSVPVAQSLALVEQLQSLDRPVELHVYAGEGHGWGRPETVVDELERIEKFLRRHVPGPTPTKDPT